MEKPKTNVEQCTPKPGESPGMYAARMEGAIMLDELDKAAADAVPRCPFCDSNEIGIYTDTHTRWPECLRCKSRGPDDMSIADFAARRMMPEPASVQVHIGGPTLTTDRLADYHRKKANNADAERQRIIDRNGSANGIERCGQRYRFHRRAVELLQSLTPPQIEWNGHRAEIGDATLERHFPDVGCVRISLRGRRIAFVDIPDTEQATRLAALLAMAVQR